MDPAYVAAIESFRARRVAKYASAEGWLTLVDRIWLGAGTNPTPLGAIQIDGGRAVLTPAPGVTVTRAGVALAGPTELAGPGPGHAGDVLEAGGRRYEVGELRGELNLRVRDPEAPARRGFTGIPAYPIDPALRIVARFEPAPPGTTATHATSDGAESVTTLAGKADFEVAGVACRLECYVDESGKRLHIPFADLTSRDETYGGGRFLYADPAVDGRVVLDFNLAFNPPCAFNSLVSCPLPPAQNRLAVAIRAGERGP